MSISSREYGCVPVHPHVCGEHLYIAGYITGCFGSSPRMWGTFVKLGLNGSYNRFIPTYVGNICAHTQRPFLFSVHPHVCGEHLDSCPLPSCSAGSSPRMWGTFFPADHNRLCCRFIPTYVGNIRSRRCSMSFRSVHPHVCGEHWHIYTPVGLIIGSSPRMWGTCDLLVGHMQPLRFIPTYVGNM